MTIVNSLNQVVGNTPLYRFNNDKWDIPKNIELYGKMEFLNPGGSIKDRTVMYMFEKMEKEGIIKKGSHIVDANAGNTGVAMAWIGASKGYKITVILPDNYVVEKQIMMRTLGAEVINVDNEIAETEIPKVLNEYIKNHPDAIFLNQYDNLRNFEGHYNYTGKEILNELDGNINYFVASAGTGGSFTGISKYLKDQNKSIRAILVNPEGSIYSGKPAGKFKVAGVGNHFFPKNLDLNIADEIIDYKDVCAHKMVKELAVKTGMLLGTASGLNVYGCLKLIDKIKETKEKIRIVTLLTDDGWRYISEDIYDASKYVEIKSKLLVK